MAAIYSQNDREFIFLCSYEMFYTDHHITKTINESIKKFVDKEIYKKDVYDLEGNPVEPGKDKIGIYTCYEGPMH